MTVTVDDLNVEQRVMVAVLKVTQDLTTAQAEAVVRHDRIVAALVGSYLAPALAPIVASLVELVAAVLACNEQGTGGTM